MTDESSFGATLDPPGAIVVVGTTPIGIEAALYGRCLGYDVTLIAGADAWANRGETNPATRRIGPTFQNDWFTRFWLNGQTIAERYDDAMPMMPDRCLSPLALSAITAQRDDTESTLPITMRQWIEDALLAVVETDLLRGRVFPNTFVDSMKLVPVLDEEQQPNDSSRERELPDDALESGDQEDDDDIPPDFLLSLRGDPIDADDETDNPSLRCECVIVADVPIDAGQLGFALPVDYFFRLESSSCPDAADELRSGWQQITRVFAGLAGRDELDLYRPRRV